MSCLYDTLAIGNLEDDLIDENKLILSRWITRVTKKDTIESIYLLITEHARRDNMPDYKNPYKPKIKTYSGNESTMFALNEFPVQLRNILWKFYSFHIEQN